MQTLYNPASWLLATCLLVMSTTQGCTSSSPVKSKTMTIVGNWKKSSQNTCSEKYPETLTFEQNNLYRGKGAENARLHPVWDVGTYELKDHAIGITTANDALVWYSLKLQDDVLTLRDPDGCPIQYKREP